MHKVLSAFWLSSLAKIPNVEMLGQNYESDARLLSAWLYQLDSNSFTGFICAFVSATGL